MGVLRAIVFDVDFTLARPGPDLGPEGYRVLGKRYGLDLDPARYDDARAAAFTEVKRHPELDHDEEIWVLFTERIIIGMGGRGDTYAAAVEMERRWGQSVHFELYDDALPALEAKLEGHELTPPEPERETAPVIDLMEALRASVAAAQSEPAKKPAARRKRAATK